MPTALRQPTPETWGKRVERHVMSQGALQPQVDRIADVCGPFIPSRNIFRRLFGYTDAPQTDDSGAQCNAWLLLTAVGYDPNEFGISDEILPPAWNAATLRGLLLPATGCFTATSAIAA